MARHDAHERAEVEQAVRDGLTALGLAADAVPADWAKAVDRAVATGSGDAIALGAVRRARRARARVALAAPGPGDGGVAQGVADAEDAVALLPFHQVQATLAGECEVAVLLTFNMLVARRVPPAEPGLS